VITSTPLFEPVDPAGRYQVECLFFPLLGGRVKSLVRRRTRLRQAIKAASYPAGIYRTWQALRSSPPGVLHLHWALIPRLDALLVRALKARGWRIVYTVHDPLPGADRRLAHRRYQALLALVDALIAHTPHLAHQLVSAYPKVSGRVHVIPHGGAALPLPSPADRARARQSLGLQADGPLLLFFGMIKPYKGLEYLLEAMPAVRAAFPRARLVIAGEPLMPLAPIEDQIERLRLGDAVVLRPSFVPQDDVPHYFAAADLLVAPYVEIAASGVVALAQGHGLPVVVTRVGGLPEFVELDGCGFVVPPRSSEALADAVCTALADPEGLVEMGRRAWRRISRDHDWSHVARETRELYRPAAVPDSGRGAK
jgi:glycosyltransferase involved in cell wall biosynthesis